MQSGKHESEGIISIVKYSFLHGISARPADKSQSHSVRPKRRVNTETTETEISVRFTEPKPIIPNRNTVYIKNVKKVQNVLLNLCNCVKK